MFVIRVDAVIDRSRAFPRLARFCCRSSRPAAVGCRLQVITTECSPYFSWQTLGMFYSHRKSGQPGPITRIMCCTPEEYERLPAADRDLVPTHVAPSYTHHPRNGDTYSVRSAAHGCLRVAAVSSAAGKPTCLGCCGGVAGCPC